MTEYLTDIFVAIGSVLWATVLVPVIALGAVLSYIVITIWQLARSLVGRYPGPARFNLKIEF